MPKIAEIASWQVQQISELLAECPTDNPLVIADYTAEEFAELKRGESYEDYLQIRELVLRQLQKLGIAGKIVLYPVDSVKYYRFLAEHKIENDSKALAYFANIEYLKSIKKD